jgi:FixJ family two-component response regulator
MRDVHFLVRVVDDDPSTLEGLGFMLRCEGYDVKTYSSAADFLRDDMPTVSGCVILDVRLRNCAAGNTRSPCSFSRGTATLKWPWRRCTPVRRTFS